MRIEEKFENQMLNIEMQVVTVANADSRLSDFQVEKVYNAFVRKYKALLMGREAKEVSLPSPAGDLYELIEVVCNLFTEDDDLFEKNDFLQDINFERLSYQDMLDIFKRLRKSLRTWTKRGGSQGYIYYISQFVPLPTEEEADKNPIIDSFIEEGLANVTPPKSKFKKLTSLFSKKQ